MRINIPIRLKNPTFWINIGTSIFITILAYFGMNWSEVTTWGTFFGVLLDAIKNPVIVFAVLGIIWNALNDPTTKGLSDSKRALNYTEPK